MKKWPIAIQVYSVREDAERDFIGTMQRLKQMGYDGVELAGTYGETAAHQKQILDEIGLELVSAHVPMDQLEEDAVLDDYASTGMKYIVIPWCPAPKDEQELEAVIERFRKIAVRVKERGMQLLYHNHDFEFNKIGGSYILDTYYREIPEELLKTELDVCWVNVGGEKPAPFVRKYAGRAPIVHLKDFSGEKTENMYGLIGTEEKQQDASQVFQFRPVGYGLQDWPSIVEAAEDAGASWLVVEQDDPSMGRSRMECARMSINYLRSFL